MITSQQLRPIFFIIVQFQMLRSIVRIWPQWTEKRDIRVWYALIPVLVIIVLNWENYFFNRIPFDIGVSIMALAVIIYLLNYFLIHRSIKKESSLT